MSKKIQVTLLSFIVLATPFAFSLPSLAQTRVGTTPTTTESRIPVTGDVDAAAKGQTLVNPLKGINSLPELLKAVLDAVVYLGGIVLTIAIIWVGFKFVLAQGKEEKLREARSALMWTLIGGLILLGASAISLAIQSTVSSLQK